MPICPRCNATIHREAKEQCPACGYSLVQQERLFGRQQITFPRVLDHAGVLLQQERNALLSVLSNLERYIPPVALCIYLTNHGQSQEFRSHAHWILNHARIHTPSFGRREGRRAIEDADLRERRPGDVPLPEPGEEHSESLPERCWHWLSGMVRDYFAPYPPPVRHEWMLVLVVDVQLKMACFSWGYMLDPYINPDKINSCITAARLQFRERDTVSALELVMKKAAQQIAKSARRVNRTLGKGGRIVSPLLAGMLGISLMSLPAAWAAPARSSAKAPAKTAAKGISKSGGNVRTGSAKSRTRSSGAKTAAKQTAAKQTMTSGQASPKPAAPKQATAEVMPVDIPDDAIAEEAEESVETAPVIVSPAPASASPADTSEPSATDVGAAACYATAPRWSREDYKNLMEGKLSRAYNLILPQGKVAVALSVGSQRASKDESDTTVLGRYCPEYKSPTRAGLSDPQGLLSDMERADAEHVLREYNAHANFRIYAAVFKAGQSIPQELNATTLVTGMAKPCEYAAVILYSLGDEPEVQLGFQEISLTDEQQRERTLRARTAACQAGGGVEGLLAAIRFLHDDISLMSKDFRPIKPETQVNIPRIEIRLKDEGEKKEKSARERFREWTKTPEATALFLKIGIGALITLPLAFFFILRRRVVRLIDTVPDVRLSSPYGAGVSRYVRYLDGKEAPREKSPF